MPLSWYFANEAEILAARAREQIDPDLMHDVPGRSNRIREVKLILDVARRALLSGGFKAVYFGGKCGPVEYKVADGNALKVDHDAIKAHSVLVTVDDYGHLDAVRVGGATQPLGEATRIPLYWASGSERLFGWQPDLHLAGLLRSEGQLRAPSAVTTEVVLNLLVSPQSLTKPAAG